MANPFDFNEDEAQRQFEKSVIFGVSPHDSDFVKTHEFMKTSLAAANMLNDFEEENDNIVSMTTNDGSFSYTKSARNQSKRAPPKYTTAELLYGNDFKDGLELDSWSGRSCMRLEDHVMEKAQVSALEFQKISDELREANRTIQNLKSEKWKSLSVAETVQRMVTGKEYFLEGYKRLNEKQELLSSTVKTNDGNAIIVVVLFLERTLKDKLFLRELHKYMSAFSQYAQHLRQCQEWDKLEHLYKEMYLLEDAAMVRYEKICGLEDSREKLNGLQNWVKDFGLKTEISEFANYIRSEISLLEQQRQIDEEDKKRMSSNKDITMQYHPPTFNVVHRPLITTVSYCAKYHFDNKTSKHHPEHFKKTYQLSDKQYEWAVLPPRANLHKWSEIQELLTSTKWLKRKAEVSAIGFEHVSTILYKAKANEEIMNKYLSLISNLDVRIKYASKFNAHDVVIDAIVQSRDRARMEEYRLKIAQSSKYRQKINDLLNNTAIKWR